MISNVKGLLASAIILLKKNNQVCFQNVQQVTKVPEKLLSFAVRCKNLTVSNARTVLLTPEIYISQNVYEQLVDLLLEAVNRACTLSPLHSHS